MVKTSDVKVDKKTYTVDYDTDEYEELIYEASVSAKEGMNASRKNASGKKLRDPIKCIHCKVRFSSKQRLNCHRLKGCDRAFDVTGKPLKLKLYPSVTSGGAAEVKDTLEKRNLPVTNAFNCIHCNKECASKQQLDYHCSVGCPGVLGMNGQPLQHELFPPVPSGGAAEVRDILQKQNLHRACEFQESDELASSGEDVLHGSPLQLPCNDGSELPDTACVTPIVDKEHPESHEVSAEFRVISEKHSEPEERNRPAGFREDVIPHGSPLQLLWEDGSELPDVLCVTPIVYKEHPESHEVSFLVMGGLSFSPLFVYQEELDKVASSIYRGKGLFDFLWQKANKALCVASVPEREERSSAIGLDPNLTVCQGFSYAKIYPVIVDRIVEDNTRVVIADVPSTIWATMTGFVSRTMAWRVMNIIIMGCHEDCTRSGEAEGERWISWGGAGSLEGHMKGFTPQEQKEYVEWVSDLLWNCNNLIISRRGLMPKSVVPGSFHPVSNSLDGCQDMHNLKEVLVTQPAKSQDSSERCKRKSLANGSPGDGEGSKRRFWNSSGNEDIINSTRQQQPDGEQFTRVFRLTNFGLAREFAYSLMLLWQEQELIVVEGYLACLAMTESNLQQELNQLAGYLDWIAKEKSKPFFRLYRQGLSPVLIKWPFWLLYILDGTYLKDSSPMGGDPTEGAKYQGERYKGYWIDEG